MYFLILVGINLYAYTKKQDGSFVGERSLSFWVTAIAAHASDMSTWLFMGFPAAVYTLGLHQCWAAVGLVVFMFLNWQFVAPKIRFYSEKYQTFTLSGLLHNHFSGENNHIKWLCAVISLGFFSIYVAAGFIGIGTLLERLFHVPYSTSVLLTIGAVCLYMFFGGYLGIAYADFFQGMFLLVVILVVPFMLWTSMPEVAMQQTVAADKLTWLHPTEGWLQAVLLACGWGLGYFGQPHILTKFMGIANQEDLPKSKWLGCSWQTLSLLAALAIGVLSWKVYPGLTENEPELIFMMMTQELFFPFLAGLILCALLAATLSTIDSQILVIVGVIIEDIMGGRFKSKISADWGGRLCVVLTCVCSYFIALSKPMGIFKLVEYAWSGLGAAFGPIMLFALGKNYKSWQISVAMVLGALGSALWPLWMSGSSYPPLLVGFLLNSGFLLVCAFFSGTKNSAAT